MSEAFPFVRITVLGASGCGKTSLIHCFINNSIPVEITPTAFPELYYRVVRLPSEADSTGPTTSVCVEIEDTVAPEITVENTLVFNKESNTRKSLPTLSIQHYFNMSRTPMIIPENVTDFTPFSIWKAPEATQSTYTPLTQARMAFLIVFDANDRDSFDTACHIHLMLQESLDVQKVRIRPYICFVANKVEKDPLSEKHKLIIQLAEQYTQRAFVRLMKVSAFTAKNVKRLLEIKSCGKLNIKNQCQIWKKMKIFDKIASQHMFAFQRPSALNQLERFHLMETSNKDMKARPKWNQMLHAVLYTIDRF